MVQDFLALATSNTPTPPPSTTLSSADISLYVGEQRTRGGPVLNERRIQNNDKIVGYDYTTNTSANLVYSIQIRGNMELALATREATCSIGATNNAPTAVLFGSVGGTFGGTFSVDTPVTISVTCTRGIERYSQSVTFTIVRGQQPQPDPELRTNGVDLRAHYELIPIVRTPWQDGPVSIPKNKFIWLSWTTNSNNGQTWACARSVTSGTPALGWTGQDLDTNNIPSRVGSGERIITEQPVGTAIYQIQCTDRNGGVTTDTLSVTLTQ